MPLLGSLLLPARGNPQVLPRDMYRWRLRRSLLMRLDAPWNRDHAKARFRSRRPQARPGSSGLPQGRSRAEAPLESIVTGKVLGVGHFLGALEYSAERP